MGRPRGQQTRLLNESFEFIRIAPDLDLRVNLVKVILEQERLVYECLASAIEGCMEIRAHFLGGTVRPEIETELLAGCWPLKQKIEEEFAGGVGSPHRSGDRNAIPFNLYLPQ